jgi:site-specific DNA-cytosine methylase
MTRRRLSVLVACEMSGRVRWKFAQRGWDAWSADFLPDESAMWNEDYPPYAPPWPDHGTIYQGDVLDIIDRDWDLVIGHPPCERLTQAGARYWAKWRANGEQGAAAAFFMQMIQRPPSTAYVVVENPVGVMTRLFRPPNQTVEPWWFGDPLSKKTCLWYRQGRYVLPLLNADRRVDPTGRVATGGGSWRVDQAHGRLGSNQVWEDSQGRARRHILRGITPLGFARAAAEQWGEYIESRRHHE